MKKSIWIVLPIVIIAIVLVTVFVSQRNSLSDQVTKLESERTELTHQRDEALVEAKNAQEEAETTRVTMTEQVQQAKTKVEEAEGKAQEAMAALTDMTTQRDTLQQTADNASAMLATGIQQVQEALDALKGDTQEEAAEEVNPLAAELDAAKQELATVTAARDEALAQAESAAAQLSELQLALQAMTTERDELAAKAENAAADSEAALELEQTKEALAAITTERDQLKTASESQAATLTELEASIAAITAQRDELQQAYNNDVIKVQAYILDKDSIIVKEYEDASQLKLEELELPAGDYFIRIVFQNAEGEEITHYDLPYTVAETKAAAAEPTSEPIAEDAEATQGRRRRSKRRACRW